MTLDDINTIMRYVDELYDTVQAVPRHGDWEIPRPGPIGKLVGALARGAGEMIRNATGLPKMGAKDKILTLAKGTKIGKKSLYSQLARVGL